MTEASSERIKPPRAVYKETPYESPARIGNGVDVFDEARQVKTALHETAMTLAAAPSPAARYIKGIEEAPRDTSSTLIDAVQKVYAAVTRQISYHDREAARLRESLKPFAAMARQSDAEMPSGMADGIRALLDIADKLPQTGEQKS